MMIKESLMEVSTETVQSPTRVYRRELPGAGYVAIDVTRPPHHESDEQGDAELSRVRVYVERRASEERRSGHTPPLVAEFAGDHRAPEVGELYRMAADNAALARALLQWQGRRRRRATAD
ncbi:MAG TPA: hypothetical protein VGP84_20255 [Gemmatimonadaceae bacterium]|jgi:hypothetical protein|nr:hypothetical protein [Gemmatimonadaceae bacterium]